MALGSERGNVLAPVARASERPERTLEPYLTNSASTNLPTPQNLHCFPSHKENWKRWWVDRTLINPPPQFSATASARGDGSKLTGRAAKGQAEPLNYDLQQNWHNSLEFSESPGWCLQGPGDAEALGQAWGRMGGSKPESESKREST